MLSAINTVPQSPRINLKPSVHTLEETMVAMVQSDEWLSLIALTLLELKNPDNIESQDIVLLKLAAQAAISGKRG